jgi:hypothetical protein
MTEEQSTLLVATSRGLMQALQDIKALKATTFRTLRFPAESPLNLGIKTQLKEYHDKTHGNPGHTCGSPDLWAWRGLILFGLKHFEETKNQPALTDFLAHSADCTPEKLAILVGHCKPIKCRKVKDEVLQVRLEIGSHHSLEKIVSHLADYVKTCGGAELTGKAPRGPAERTISTTLVAMKIYDDKKSNPYLTDDMDTA